MTKEQYKKMAGLIAKRDEQLLQTILAFERVQHKTKGIDGKPLRGPLPCDIQHRPKAPLGNFARNILEILNVAPRNAKEIAEELNCHHRAASSMLSALTNKSLAFKIGERPTNGYAITQVGREALAA